MSDLDDDLGCFVLLCCFAVFIIAGIVSMVLYH